MKISGKPASIGAIIMLGGGLMIYWALSQWKLFGLGGSSTAATVTGNAGPPAIDNREYSPPLFAPSNNGGGGSSGF